MPPPDRSQPFLRVIAVIPERRDRLSVLVRLFLLMLATCLVAAWVVGAWQHLGWHGALNGAGSALIIFPVLTLLASVTMGGGWKADDRDVGYFWRVLIGWAMILTVISVAWIASAHPGLYGG